MKALRVSASDIDALRYYLAHDEADLGELLAQLRREKPPTEAMRVGTALHKALEHCPCGDHAELEADGYKFEMACGSAEIDLPDIREVKATRDYLIGGDNIRFTACESVTYDHVYSHHAAGYRFSGGEETCRRLSDCLVTLVGKVDAINGRRVDDHKFTSRYDAERFLGSYQWRIYLDVFGADEFRWNIFEGTPDTRNPKRYVIRSVHKLRMYRYPGMGSDIERALEGFVSFAWQHLPEQFTETTIFHDEMMSQLMEPQA